MRRLLLLPLLVLLIGIISSAAVTSELWRAVYAKDQERFENSVQRTRDSIVGRIDMYVSMLRGARGMFVTNKIDRAKFHNYVAVLEVQKRYPGVQGIGFSFHFPAAEKDSVVAELRRQGLTDFHVWPDQPRQEYHSIVFLEPLERRNQAAIGYDMFTEPVRRAAMERARDTGAAAASGKVTLVQEIDPQKQAGFLIYVPVYTYGDEPKTVAERRAGLGGFVYSPFRADDLFDGLFGSEEHPRVDFDVFDQIEAPENQLYRTATRGNYRPRFTSRQPIDIAGRTWMVAFRTRPDFELGSSSKLIPSIFIAGLLISVALSLLSWLQTRARAAAERSAVMKDAVVRSALDCIVTMDHRGRIVEFNPAAERTFGYRRDEVVGRKMQDMIIPPSLRELHTGGLARYLKTGEAIVIGRRIELPAMRKGGEEFPVELTVTRNPGGANDPPTFTGFIRDLTGPKRTEALLREESDAVETINRVGRTINAELDLPKLVQAVTDATTALIGAQFGAFFSHLRDDRGQNDSLRCVSGDESEKLAHLPRATPLIDATLTGQGAIRLDDARNDPRAGEWGAALSSYLAVPVVSRSGEVLGGLFFGHERPGVFDERDERIVVGIAAQAAIAIDNARLYSAEQRARSDAERANQIKDEFLATLSHELRTPLSAILGWSHLLQTGKSDAQEIAQGLDVIERNARVQTQLIEDLLDMSRIISGKLRLEMQRVDLRGVIGSSIPTLAAAAEAKQIRLSTALDPEAVMVLGDVARLQQVLWNLLSNAVKFTARGGSVHVDLRRTDGHAELCVIDSGQGIDSQFLPHLFERFRQADASTTRRHGGLGLGLSIVRSLIEMHGGTVSAASEGEARGATFTILLPLIASASQRVMPAQPPIDTSAQEPQQTDRTNLAGVKILIVDDDADGLELLRVVLKARNAEVIEASCVADALALMEKHRPDVLISDIGMPGQDGYDLIRQVRAMDVSRGGAVPGIALTAYARSEDRQRALLSGFQMHLVKPVEARELVAAVGALMGRSTNTAARPD